MQKFKKGDLVKFTSKCDPNIKAGAYGWVTRVSKDGTCEVEIFTRKKWTVLALELKKVASGTRNRKIKI